MCSKDIIRFKDNLYILQKLNKHFVSAFNSDDIGHAVKSGKENGSSDCRMSVVETRLRK